MTLETPLSTVLPSYEQVVNNLTTSWEDPERYIPLDQLFKIIGCYSMERCEVQGWRITLPVAVDATHEAVVRDALRRITRRRIKTDWVDEAETMSLLDGLRENDRWRDYLPDVDMAHSLAAMLIEFADIEENVATFPPINIELARIVAPSVHHIISHWFFPLAPKRERCPTAPEMARRIFGDAWVELMIDPKESGFRYISNMVRSTRPPFRQGLISEQAHSLAIELPTL